MAIQRLYLAQLPNVDRREFVTHGSRSLQMKPGSVEWLAAEIRRLPSDEAVAKRTPGYNNYTTQKDHWLGWLDPQSGTGTYRRATGQSGDALRVYNRINEAKMLLWLSAAAGLPEDLVNAARIASEGAKAFPSKCKAVRQVIPWELVYSALAKRESEER